MKEPFCLKPSLSKSGFEFEEVQPSEPFLQRSSSRPFFEGPDPSEYAFICVSHVVTVYTEHRIVKIEVEVGSVGLNGTKKSIQIFC